MSDQEEGEEVEARVVHQFRTRSDPKLPLDVVLLQMQGLTSSEWYLLQAGQVDVLIRELQGWRDWMKKRMS